MTHATDASAKAVLRLHVRGLRRAFVRDHPEADWQAGDRAGELIERLFHGRKTTGVVAVYRASGAEIDPRPLSEALLELGWKLALPTCDALDEAVLFRAWKPGDRLSPDICGIAAPLVSAPQVEPDVVVAPLIAFDRHGGRLGQGGGYYDRTFSELRLKVRPPLFVGLGFSIQEVDRIPIEPHDERLDAILTEKEYIAVRKDL